VESFDPTARDWRGPFRETQGKVSGSDDMGHPHWVPATGFKKMASQPMEAATKVGALPEM